MAPALFRKRLLVAIATIAVIAALAFTAARSRTNATPLNLAYRWFEFAPSGTIKDIACHGTHHDAIRARVVCAFRVTDYWSGFGPGKYVWSFSFHWKQDHWKLVNYGVG